jgi:hypothetical protein
MTPDQLQLWLNVCLPVLDRALAFVLLVSAAWLAYRVPWLRFIAWLSAPSITSLVFVSAFCISAQTFLSSDEAYKYVNAYLLFALKLLFGCFGNGFIALKALRMKAPEDPKP